MDINFIDLNKNIDSVIIGGKSGLEFIQVGALAEKLGASDVGLRFVMGLFAGFPFAMMYPLLNNCSTDKKHLYFSLTGILINYFCFGIDVVYTLTSIFIFHLSTAILGGTIYNVIFAFIFQTCYLMAGYVMNASSEGYDIKWTTPQCVLCMRLIGLAWDVYDGHQKEDILSKDQLETRVLSKPKLLEVFGFSYCFAGFLAGPQFSFTRYVNFVEGNLIDEDAKRASFSKYVESFKKFCTALLVILFFQIFDEEYRPEKFLLPSFQDVSFVFKVLDMGLVFYVQFSKYVISWCLSESVCILLGLSYNGKTSDGSLDWNGLCNFQFMNSVFGTFFQDFVSGFNIQTNLWVGKYLFRRLRFLGNKTLSHVITLVYLALWHGFYVGYLFLFLWEYLQLIVERQMCATLRKIFGPFHELSVVVKLFVRCIGVLLRFCACGFYVQSFMLLRWRKIKIVYASVYYWPVVMFCSWFFIARPFLSFFIKHFDVKKKEDVKKSEMSNAKNYYDVLLFVPNLIGYVRILLILLSLIFKEYFLLCIIIASCLDMIDGIAARYKNQESAFGEWLDVTTDLFSRGILWCRANPSFGYLIFGFEFLIFTCTHSAGKGWQDKVQIQLHWYAAKTVSKGFKSFQGFAAILGLWVLPLWTYVKTHETWLHFGYVDVYVTWILILCRLHCGFVELLVLKRHVAMLLQDSCQTQS